MPDVYFCTNCFFFGYAETMVYQKIHDGFGDRENTTESTPFNIECPDCGETIVAVKIDGSTYDLMQKIAKMLEEMYSKDEDTESDFEFYDYPSHSRVLTYIVLESGRNPRKVKVPTWDRHFEYIPLDDVTTDLLLKKLIAEHPRTKELAEELLKELFQTKLQESCRLLSRMDKVAAMTSSSLKK